MITLCNILIPKNHTFKPILLFLFLLISCSLSSQAVIESIATNETGGDGAYSLDAKPSGVQEGDLLLAVACYEGGESQIVTSPQDWIQIEKTDHNSDVGMVTFYKVADLQDVSATTFTFELSEDKKWTLGISRITGFEPLNAINVYSENSGSSGDPIASSVLTTENDCLILSIYGNKKEASYEGDYNEEYEIENTDGGIASQMVESFVQEEAGSTSNTTAVPSEKDAWIAQQIAIEGSAVTLLNNFRSLKSGNYQDVATWEREKSDGTWLSPSDIVPQANANINIRNLHVVVSSNNLVFQDAQIKVECGGELKVQF